MAEWSRGGLVTKTVGEYRREIEQRWRRVFPDINLAVETPQGQLIGLEAEAWAKGDEALAVLVGGMSLETAAGRQLDAIGSILGVKRSRGSYTRVDIEVGGIMDGTVIGEGTRFKIEGAVFLSEGQVQLKENPTVVKLRSWYAGAVSLLSDSSVVVVDKTANEVVDLGGREPARIGVVGGSVRLGREGESDSSLRSRYYGLGVRSTNTVEAVRSAVMGVDGVRYVEVYEDGFQPDWDIASKSFRATEPSGVAVDRGDYHGVGVSFPYDGILVITEGGEVGEIEAAIVSSRPVGVEWEHARGARGIVGIKLETVVTDDFAGNGVQSIRERVLQWWRGEWVEIPGGGLSYGDRLDKDLVRAIASTVPGHKPLGIEFSQWTLLAPLGSEIAVGTELGVEDANPCLRYELDPNRIVIEARVE